MFTESKKKRVISRTISLFGISAKWLKNGTGKSIFGQMRGEVKKYHAEHNECLHLGNWWFSRSVCKDFNKYLHLHYQYIYHQESCMFNVFQTWHIIRIPMYCFFFNYAKYNTYSIEFMPSSSTAFLCFSCFNHHIN